MSAVGARVADRPHLLGDQISRPSLTPVFIVIVCGCRVRLETNSSWRVNSSRTGRPVARARWPTMSSISISCLTPNPPPIRGLMTRMLPDGHLEQRGQHPANVERDLGRGPNHQSFVAIQPGNGDMRLDRNLLDLVDPEGLLEDMIRLGEPGLDIPDVGPDVMNDVALGVVGAFHVGLVVDHRRRVLHRFVLVEDRRQHLVLHVDEFDGRFGDLERVGRDDGHSIADMADLVVEADLIVREWIRVALTSGGVPHPATFLW